MVSCNQLSYNDDHMRGIETMNKIKRLLMSCIVAAGIFFGLGVLVFCISLLGDYLGPFLTLSSMFLVILMVVHMNWED